MAEVLLEQLKSSTLSFINESINSDAGKKYIGRLKGECAECDKPTRNGRVYSRKLWEKVINGETFKEYLENKCLYGELNHPSDRLETDIKEVAIALSDIEMKDNGPVIATFDILDTPNGRLLKSLCEYGSKLGVSSRGGGDVVTRDGMQYVDEESYDFVAFDVVALPAVKKARPAVIESVEYKNKALSLKESINKEIENMNTQAELTSLQRIVENLNLPDNDSIQESIKNKLDSLAGDTNSATLLEDLNQAIEKSSSLEMEKAELQEKLSAGTTREMKLDEENKKFKSAIRLLSDKLEKAEANKTASATRGNKLTKDVQTLSNSKEALEEEIKRLKIQLASANKKAALTEELKKTNLSLKESVINTNILSESIKVEKDKVAKLEKNYQVLEGLNKDIQMKANSTARKLNEALITAKNFKETNFNLLERVLDNICRQKGIRKEDIKSQLSESFTLEEIDKLVEQTCKYKLRVGSLPFQTGESISVRANAISESTRVKRFTNPDDDNLQGAATLLNITK